VRVLTIRLWTSTVFRNVRIAPPCWLAGPVVSLFTFVFVVAEGTLRSAGFDCFISGVSVSPGPSPGVGGREERERVLWASLIELAEPFEEAWALPAPTSMVVRFACHAPC
jgi:hypothetical protein